MITPTSWAPYGFGLRRRHLINPILDSNCPQNASLIKSEIVRITNYDWKRHLIRLLIAFVSLLSLFPSASYAYLDPGTGSYVFQIIVGIALGAAFAIKAFWVRIKMFFTDLVSRRPRGE